MAEHFLCRIHVGKNVYLHDETVTDVVQYLLGLLLLPAHDIVGALQDIRITIAIPTDHTAVVQLQQLVAYVKRQRLDRRSVGPNRVCVPDNRARTNNILESYHSGLRGAFNLATRICSTSYSRGANVTDW